jgi:hypothetical protein
MMKPESSLGVLSPTRLTGRRPLSSSPNRSSGCSTNLTEPLEDIEERPEDGEERRPQGRNAAKRRLDLS